MIILLKFVLINHKTTNICNLNNVVYTMAIHQSKLNKGVQIMLSKIQKWGNSQGIRISKNLLENSYIKIGDEVDISNVLDAATLELTSAVTRLRFGGGL